MTLIPQEGYRALPALNASYLKHVLTHSKWHADLPVSPTPAMLLGTLIHSKILEPEKDDEFAVFEGDRRTKAGKELYAELQQSGKMIVTRDQMDTALSTAAAIAAHPKLAEYLERSVLREQSMTFELGGHDCKAQVDLYSEGGVLIDLKTTADVHKAERQFFNMNYALQMWWYREALRRNGYDVHRCAMIFVETSAPYQCAFYEIGGDILRHGEGLARLALDRWVEQSAQPTPALIEERLTLPGWLKGD